MEEIKVFQEYVLGFAFDFMKTEILLIEKKRPEWQKGRFNGIGGKVEKNESPYKAMRREFSEEANVKTNAWEQFAILEGNNFKVHFFRVELNTALFYKVKQITDERLQKFLVEDLPPNIIDNLNWLIPMAGSRQRKDWIFKIIERSQHFKAPEIKLPEDELGMARDAIDDAIENRRIEGFPPDGGLKIARKAIDLVAKMNGVKI